MDQGIITSVWYRFTAAADGNAHFDTCTNVLYDGFMSAYTGSAVDALTNVTFNDDGCGGFGTGSVVDFPVTAGTVYSIAIDGWEEETGDFTLTYTLPGGPATSATATTSASATTASTTSATTSATSATTATSATASATSAASTTTGASATTATGSATTTATSASATSATSGPTAGALSRAERARPEAEHGQGEDPGPALPRRHDPQGALEASRPSRRPEPTRRRGTPAQLQGQPAGGSQVGTD